MPTEEDIKQALRSVKYPGFSRDIVSFGLIKQIDIRGGNVVVRIALTTPNKEIAAQIKEEGEQAIRQIAAVQDARVDVEQPAGGTTTPGAPPSPFAQQTRIPGLKRIIAVASGKGGVGKSTVSVNLAGALKHLGARVGLLDCDIYGPSIPLMMGVHEKPTLTEDDKMVPPIAHGVKVLSMGLLMEGDQPVIWRGPMINKTIQQFFHAVEWGELDFLLVDLPPGTGDAQLSLCQTVPLDGGVIVTTPQEASLGVVRKGIAMFQKVNVPIIGLVENMSYFTTPNGERIEIFGHGGGKAEARRQDIPFLGEVPLFTQIREGGDRGLPVVIGAPQSEAGATFLQIGAALRNELAKR